MEFMKNLKTGFNLAQGSGKFGNDDDLPSQIGHPELVSGSQILANTVVDRSRNTYWLCQRMQAHKARFSPVRFAKFGMTEFVKHAAFTFAEGATHTVSLPKKAKGFTLAEVLITLGIIGVVAALTIPTLMTNYKKKQYYTQFMKARSALENAIKLFEDEHGILYDSDVEEYLTGEKVKDLAAYFPGAQLVTLDNYEDLLQGYNKLKIAFNYDGSNREEDDFDADGVGNAGMFEGNEQGFITNDGMLYMLNIDGGFGSGGIVDINGPNSGPNTYGRDIFAFYLNKTQQKNDLCNSMWGMKSQCATQNGWSVNPCYGDNKDGTNCAARLIEEGKMNY